MWNVCASVVFYLASFWFSSSWVTFLFLFFFSFLFFYLSVLGSTAHFFSDGLGPLHVCTSTYSTHSLHFT